MDGGWDDAVRDTRAQTCKVGGNRVGSVLRRGVGCVGSFASSHHPSRWGRSSRVPVSDAGAVIEWCKKQRRPEAPLFVSSGWVAQALSNTGVACCPIASTIALATLRLPAMMLPLS